MSEEKKTPQKKVGKAEKESKLGSRLAFVALGIVFVAFAVYAVVTLLTLHSQIRERKAELDDIKGEISVQEIKNDEMSKLYNYSDDEFSDYVEQIARDDLDYVKEGERVFVNVAGD